MSSIIDQIIPVDTSSSFVNILSEVGDDIPLIRLFQIAEMHGCKTIVTEKNVYNEQWHQEHAGYYSKQFKPFDTMCTRLSFFAAKFTKEEELQNLETNQCIGFCVLRPIPKQRVAEALIKPLKDGNMPPKSFNLCSISELITIGGVDFEIEGFPFMQQDSEYDCCATVCLWMVSKYMSSAFGTDYKSVAEIQTSIQEIPSRNRHIPTSGLLPIELSHSLNRMGLNPMVYEFNKNKPPSFSAQRILYNYIESKLPTIALIPTAGHVGHALIANGHTFDPDTWWAMAKGQYYDIAPSGYHYHSSTTWIPNFIFNDDNFGPYLNISKEYIHLVANSESSIYLMSVLPENVFLTGEESEAHVYDLLTISLIKREMEEAAKKINIWPAKLLSYLESGDIVLRSILLRSEDFKAGLQTRFNNEDVIKAYEGVELPPYVWMVEISGPEYFCHQRLRLGEILIDPTANPKRKMYPAFLTINLPGLFVKRNVKDEKLDRFELSHFEPYYHEIRG